jgi:hypothetical protein
MTMVGDSSAMVVSGIEMSFRGWRPGGPGANVG